MFCRETREADQQIIAFSLEDREAELWLPLFSVCTVAAPGKLEHLKAVAMRVSGAKQADEPNDSGILLLKDILAVFEQSQQDRMTTLNLLNALNMIEESPWATWCHGTVLDARRLAKLLRPFGVTPHNLRLEDGRIVKGYERANFEEAWALYLPPDSAATTLQTP
jgi:hypothetical protein